MAEDIGFPKVPKLRDHHLFIHFILLPFPNYPASEQLFSPILLLFNEMICFSMIT